MSRNEIVRRREHILNEFEFSEKEFNKIVRVRPSFLLYEEEALDGKGCLKLKEFFAEKGIDFKTVRELILFYPPILGKSETKLKNYYSLLEELGISEEEATNYLLQYPQIISLDIKAKFEEIFMLFELYNGLEKKDVIDIFKGFPLILCQTKRKISLFNGQFKKYRMSVYEIKNVCINSEGLLGSRVRNFYGLFDFMLHLGISASDTRRLIKEYPKFAMQNRQNLLWKKLDLIKSVSFRSDIYMRNFVRRHPDIMITSYSSMVAKIEYVSRNLNRALKNERTFPLFLHFNYNNVIRPRGEILKKQLGARNFDLRDAFCGSDIDFCKKFDISSKELQVEKSRRSRKNNQETDKLWEYYPRIIR